MALFRAADRPAIESLARAYEDAVTPHGTVNNVMQAHSLRPHTMQGHLALYRAVLHHPDDALPARPMATSSTALACRRMGT